MTEKENLKNQVGINRKDIQKNRDQIEENQQDIQGNKKWINNFEEGITVAVVIIFIALVVWLVIAGAYSLYNYCPADRPLPLEVTGEVEGVREDQVKINGTVYKEVCHWDTDEVRVGDLVKLSDKKSNCGLRIDIISW